MLALLLGAGFSKWAADLPLTSQLFDIDIDPFGIREKSRLERVKELKQQWDTKNPADMAEKFIADILCSGNDRNKKDVIWYIVRRLSDQYIWQEWHAHRMRRHVLMVDENRKWDRKGVRKVADFIARCRNHLSGIVTLNYDLLVEYALGSRGFNYGYKGEVLKGRGPYPVSQWKKPVRLMGTLPLAKLHGSISFDKEGKYTDGRRALSGNALIVAPVQENCPPPDLKEHWKLSQEIIKPASCILVFGFSFNAYDQAVLNHLQEVGCGLKEVAVIDVSSRESAAKKLWPKAQITSFPPPCDGYGALETWLRNIQ